MLGLGLGINRGFVGGAAAASFLLDDYTGAAAAYSVRRLSDSYTGSALRVREDSGDTELDIGFDSNGDLDTAAIASHCGANNGYVTKWYDQSGNSNDATQETNGSEPQIYNGTAVITENGKSALEFDGTNDELTTGASIRTATTFTVSQEDTSGRHVIYGSVTNTDAFLRTGSGATAIFSNTGATVSTSITTGNQRLLYVNNPGTGSEIANNGGSTSSGNIGSGSFANFAIGQKANQFRMDGTIQEIVVFGTDQSSNRTGIETNINDYFSIYT